MFRIVIVMATLCFVGACGCKRTPVPNALEPAVELAPPVPIKFRAEIAGGMSEYERHIGFYGRFKQEIKKGELITLPGGTPMIFGESTVEYQGIDQEALGIRVRYGVRVLHFGPRMHEPVTAVECPERLAGTPDKVIAGDVRMGDCIIHVITADDDRMECVVEEFKQPPPPPSGDDPVA